MNISVLLLQIAKLTVFHDEVKFSWKRRDLPSFSLTSWRLLVTRRAVTAPKRLTMLECSPRWASTFSSDMRACKIIFVHSVPKVFEHLSVNLLICPATSPCLTKEKVKLLVSLFVFTTSHLQHFFSCIWLHRLDCHHRLKESTQSSMLPSLTPSSPLPPLSWSAPPGLPHPWSPQPQPCERLQRRQLRSVG